MTAASKAAVLRELHHREEPLLLPNVWDAASARLVAGLGFPAVATSSAAIAAVIGYFDEEARWEDLLPLMRAIGRSVEVPVTFDVVSGFASSDDELRRHVDEVLDAGGCGINFEDGLGDPDVHAARVAAIRDHAGDALVINARTDVLFRSLGDLAETIRRGRLYRDAGADSIFVPGVVDEATIEALVQGIGAPINVLATPLSPPLSRLRELGVRRVSVGSALYRVQLDAARAAVERLRDEGSFDVLRSPFTFDKLKELMQ
jgi:2-methylisocitrate lyase-like PEP mutase family enzyme